MFAQLTPRDDEPHAPPLPVGLELAHHERVATLAEQYRHSIAQSVSPPSVLAQELVATPTELFPLAQQFAAASDCQVECVGPDERGYRFTYARQQYADQHQFEVQHLIAELRALGIGTVERVDPRGNVDYRVVLADGSQTEWFFQGTQEPKSARKLLGSIVLPDDGPTFPERYCLRFFDEQVGGHYTYWQPPDAEPLSQLLDDMGAEVYYTNDGFFVNFDGQNYPFYALEEHPDTVRLQREQLLQAGFARQERIHAALPPVPPGHIRMFRGLNGPYEERTPLSADEEQELEAFFRPEFSFESASVESIMRFGELRGRAAGQMATPDLGDVLHQYAVGPNATLLYADITAAELNQYLDRNAPSSILSGYSTFPPGRIRWNAVRLADIDVPEQRKDDSGE